MLLRLRKWGTKAHGTHHREGDTGQNTVGRKGGKDIELTNCLNGTPTDCRAGTSESNDEVHDVGVSDRR